MLRVFDWGQLARAHFDARRFIAVKMLVKLAAPFAGNERPVAAFRTFIKKISGCIEIEARSPARN